MTTPTDPSGAVQDAQKNTDIEPQEPEAEVVFETWLKEQTANVQTAYEKHTTGLRTALQTERESRSQLQKTVRDLSKKADAGSEMATQLTQLADDLALANSKLEFYEQASGRGIPYLDVAFRTAVDAGAIDAKGRINWQLLEERYPLIFTAQRPPAPKGDIGKGSKQTSSRTSMNEWIRNRGRGPTPNP